MSDARITLSAVDKTGPAFSSAQQRLSSLAGEAGGLVARFGAIGAAVGTALVGANFLRGIVDGIDRLNDLRDATGASIGNLSALEDIAGKTGTSFDTVSSALVKFNGALLGAKEGSAAEQVFKRLGLSVQELRAQDPAEAFQQVAVALAGFANDGDKARAVQILFGRSLREVAPLLNDVAEGGRLNAKVTEEQAKQAEQFNKRLAATGQLATNVGRAIVSDLLPSLNGVFAALSNLDKLRGLGFSGATLEVLKGNVFTDAGEGVAFYTQKLKELQAQRTIIAQDRNPVARRGGLIDVDAEIAKIERIRAFYTSVFSATAPDNGQTDPRELARRRRGPATPEQALGVISEGGLAAQVSEFDKYAQTLARTLVTDKELGQEQQTRLDIAAGKLGKLNQAQADYLVGLAKAIDLQNKGDPLGGFITDQLRAQQARDQNALDNLIGSSSGAQADRVIGLVQRASQLYSEGKLSLDDFTRAAEAGGKQLESLAPKTEELGNRVNTFAEQAGRNIQDVLGDSLVRALDGDFKSIEQLWADTLKKMLAQALAAQLNTALFGTLGQKDGKLGGLVGGLLSGNLGGFFGGARAMGGPVQAGKAYLVGERGPEIFAPQGSGTIIPNGAGGSVVINQTINVGQGVSRGEVAAASLQAKDAAVAEIRALMFRTGRGAL